jgi:hypothetical protein
MLAFGVYFNGRRVGTSGRNHKIEIEDITLKIKRLTA